MRDVLPALRQVGPSPQTRQEAREEGGQAGREVSQERPDPAQSVTRETCHSPQLSQVT